jgi:hypothetical protein
VAPRLKLKRPRLRRLFEKGTDFLTRIESVMELIIKPTQILANWTPEVFSVEYLEEHFPRVVADLIGPYKATYLSIRKPETERQFLGEISQWHNDGGENECFMLWSNVCPTEVKFLNGELLKVSDGDIVLVNNLEVLHRRPEVATGIDRWFIRLTPLLTGEYTGNFKYAA